MTETSIFADRIDVANCYQFFLGRPAESPAVLLEKDGQPFDMVVLAFAACVEFEERVFQPMLESGDWPADLFVAPPTDALTAWVYERLLRNTDQADRDDKPRPPLTNWYAVHMAALNATLFSKADQAPAWLGDLPAYRNRLRTAGSRCEQPVGAIDSLRGRTISGWVFDPAAPDVPAAVEFIVDGQVVHEVTASSFRADVAKAGFGKGLAGFQAQLPFNLAEGESAFVHARLKGSHCPLNNSPGVAQFPGFVQRWLERGKRVDGVFLDRLRRRLNKSTSAHTLTIIMPVYNVREEWLREALESVRTQWCDRWELICVDDCSSKEHVAAVLQEYSERDARIKVVRQARNGGISRATNAGIRAATGDYIAFMDHDDTIEPDAVFQLLRAAKLGADLIYSDEVIVGARTNDLIEVQARPAFSWDYYLSHPYFVHMIAVRASIASNVGGLDESMTISADVDFVLRALEHSHVVAHVPVVIYRWRTHPTSTGHARMGDVTEATIGALNRHVSRVRPGSVARPIELFNHHRVDFPDAGGPVLAVIPTKNRGDLVRTCVESLRATSDPSDLMICIVDHESDDPDTLRYLDSIRSDCLIVPYKGAFNYPRINNHAVREASRRLGKKPPFLLFCNNDIEAITPGWLPRMRGIAARPDVGIVGANLLYPDKTVQHSGVILGLNLAAEHGHKFVHAYNSGGDRNRGYLGSLVSARDYSAVTAAFMMMRSDVFERVGGFDERFVVGFNDTDLCLRVGATGLNIINDGETSLYHHESATRSRTNQVRHVEDDALLHERWGSLIQAGDPFHSPLFEEQGGSHQIGRYATVLQTIQLRPGVASLRNLFEKDAVTLRPGRKTAEDRILPDLKNIFARWRRGGQQRTRR